MRVRCDELIHLADDARWTDDATFLASRPGASLLLVGPKGTNPRTALVMPVSGEPGVTTLGRHPDNDIVAPWPSISRRHAAVVTSAASVFVIDRGSANGTFVGSKRLAPDIVHVLEDGEEIFFGSDLRATYLTSRGLLAHVRRIQPAA
jgi:hypothetical protein